jgi:hypothetical protein
MKPETTFSSGMRARFSNWEYSLKLKLVMNATLCALRGLCERK